MVESAEFIQAFQDEAQKTMNRVKNMVDAFVVNTADPVMSQTPKDVVWKRGKHDCTGITARMSRRT